MADDKFAVQFKAVAHENAAGFVDLLKEFLIVDLAASETKGGIAWQLRNNAEVEVGYSMGEVRVRAWTVDHKPALSVETVKFDEAAFTRMRGWLVELDATGQVAL